MFAIVLSATADELPGDTSVNNAALAVESAPFIVNVEWIQNGNTPVQTHQNVVLSHSFLRRDGYEVGEVVCSGTKQSHTLASRQVFIGRVLTIKPGAVDVTGKVKLIEVSAQDTHQVGTRDSGPDWCPSRTVETAGFSVSGLVVEIRQKGVTVIPLDANNSIRITPVSD